MSTITGTDGIDVITGTSGDDTIYGLGGNDQIDGGAGNDTIDGGPGNDIITGGAGTDTLTGGTGADTFRDTAAGLNGDTITDMQPGDRIQLTDTGFSNAGSTVTISGNMMTVTDGSLTTSFTISNVGAGRFVTRDITGGGLEIRLQQDAHSDFNGDGHSDVLWQNTDGTLTDWLGGANGVFTGNWNNFNANPGASWHVVGTGDFNGDGEVDMLLQNSDGTVTDWLAGTNGSFTSNFNNFAANPGTGWHVAATGDFNGDGKTDVLWQNSDGTVTDWLAGANGAFASNWNNFAANPGASWHVVGSGDFNNDGEMDLLLQNSDGTVTDWLAGTNGTFTSNFSNFVSNPGASWHVVGVGDFNGDSIDDILWRNNDGTVTDWLGKGDGTFTSNFNNFAANPGTSWHVASIGDFNGDSIDDIAWQNSDGTVTDWLGGTNGVFTANWNAFHTNPGASWHVQDPSIHDPLF